MQWPTLQKAISSFRQQHARNVYTCPVTYRKGTHVDLIRLTTRFGKRYAPTIALVIVLQLVTTLATLYLPDLNADIINNGVAQADVPYIWRTGRTMLVVALVQVVAAIGATWFASKAAMKTGRDIRAAVYERVTGFDHEDMSHFGTATLVTRGTNDVQQVQMTFLLFMNFMVAAPIMAIGGIIMALRQDAGMSWLVVTAVLVLTVVVGITAALPTRPSRVSARRSSSGKTCWVTPRTSARVNQDGTF